MALSKMERAAQAAAAKSKPRAESKQPPQKVASPKPGKLEVYFDSLKGCYYASNDHGEFQKWPKEALGTLLISQGYYYDIKDSNGLSALEVEILCITRKNSVHFAGPLGGYGVGAYSMLTNRILVTRGPVLI